MGTLDERRPARLGWLWVPLIVWIAGGCDNVDWVEWAGVDVRVEQAAPPGGHTLPSDSVAPSEAEPPRGPVLHAVSGAGDTATLVPVVELVDRSLRPVVPPHDPERAARRFAGERYGTGASVGLLADGHRVGTAYLESVDTLDTGFCPARPVARATVELVRRASEAGRFLALPSDAPELPPRGAPGPRDVAGPHRLAAFNIAFAEVGRRDVPRPDDWIEARRDLRLVRLREGEPPALVATYLYADALDVTPPGAEAYALFFVAEEGPEGYAPTFVWFRDYGETGKAAPRLHQVADLDGDGARELVVEIFRRGARSFAVVGFRNGAWRVLHEDPCPPGSPTGGGAGPAPDPGG